MPRVRLILLAATWSMLACRPAPEQPDVGKIGDPAPPKAPILETLTDYGAFEGDARAGADALPPGAVVSAGPSGHASTREPVVVEFSTPMRDDVDVEFAFDPHVAGAAKWTSPTRLAFVPEHSFLGAHAYTVQIRGTATTLGGQAVDVDRRLAFETPRPTVDIDADYADYRHEEDARVSWKAGFTVRLSDEASAADVRDALSVTVDGRELRYRIEGEFEHPKDTRTRYWRILPRGHWPADATIHAELGPSLKTIAGPLPTGAPVFATLHTREGVHAKIECDDSANDGCVIGSFDLKFDARLPASAAKSIRLSPKPKDFKLRPWTWRDEETFEEATFYGEFEAGKTYTVTLGRGIRDVDGQSLVGARSRPITFVAPPPTLDLRGLGTQLSGHGGMMGVESRSLEDAALVISELDNWALASLVQRGDDELARPERGVETRELQLDLTPSGTWGWDARAFDLNQELGGPSGAALFELFPGEVTPSQAGRADVEYSSGLIQVTNLGVMVADSPAGGFVRVLALDTSEPVAGATAHVYGKSFPPELIDSFGPSDDQGFIRLPRGTPLRGGVVHVVVIETDDDRVAVALDGTGHGSWGTWNRPTHGAEFDIGVIMPDRELYQPGERMRVMGWAARSTTDTPAGIEGSGTRPVTVEVEDQDGSVIARSTVRTKAYGKFWATLQIPEDAKLGTATIKAELEGDGSRPFTRRVRLREFVAPAFDVSLALDDSSLTHGQGTRAVAMARYLHGMPLPVAVAKRRVHCRPRSYRPVDTEDWGLASPEGSASYPSSGWTTLKTEPAHAKGRITFDVEFGRLTTGHSYRCEVSLLTMDAARQELATISTAWIHPSRYLLVDAGRGKRVGDRHEVRAKAVLPSGASTTAEPATALIYRISDRGEATRTGRCRLAFGSDGQARCTWTPSKPGRYEVRFSAIVDDTTVRHTDSLYVRRRLPKFGDDHVPFEVVVPESTTVGSTVEVEVQTRQPSGAGLAVEVHAGIREQHIFDVQAHRGSVRLKATESWVPRAYIDTFVVHPDARRRLPHVERAFDAVKLGYASRELEVELTNPAVASIGATLPIDVAVLDPDGQPVPDAHVSVWAVDEGILLLRDWQFPDFTRALAFDRGNEARYFDGYDDLRRPYVLRRDPFEPGWGSAGGFGSGGGSLGGTGYGGGAGIAGSGRPKTRSNFDPAPIFVGDVKTGPDGTARVHGVLPDNLTTFRIAAVATAEVAGTGAFSRAGRDESEVRVTQDLAVRAVLPRVLRPGDTAQLGVLVDNLTDVPGSLEIETELREARGIARITSKARSARRLEDAQIRVPVDVEALRDGELRVWVHATLRLDDGRVLEDASELPLEVRTERTLIRHAATYGSMQDADAGAIALVVPPHVPASAEADVDVYASMLGGYEGAASDLVSYPYGCVEQTSSRLVPLAALHGLRGFDLGVSDVEGFIRIGVERLETMVTRSGGFAYWPNGKTPHVYATAYATWVLSELKRTGIDVDEDLLKKAADYLDVELAALRTRATPTAYEDIRAAMALLAVTAVGRRNPAVTDELLARTDTLPAFARAILAMALHGADPHDARLPALLDTLRERIELRGKIARSKAESKRYAEFFDSPLRTDAMTLLALVRTAPDDPLIEPLARGLTEARDRGALRNTQENAYALLAMSDYTALREDVEPDMDVRAWIGADMVLETRFEGRDLTVLGGEAQLHEDDPLVTLQRTGAGRLYYRVGMQWAPEPETVKPRARGIAVERALFDRRGEVDGRALVAGESGTLEVTISADARQRYVAIEVPIPAGIETVDASLGRGGVTEAAAATVGSALLPYNHHELRGDRVLVFVDHLPAGTYRYRVPIRVTHEGTFSMPPATAHAMYAPEIEGNTAGSVVRVVSP